MFNRKDNDKNTTLQSELMRTIVAFQINLETTPGTLNTDKSVTRDGVEKSVSIKFGYTSRWEAAEKLRDYIDLMGSDDRLATITRVYPTLKANKYKVHDDLLAQLSRIMTKAFDLDEKTVAAHVNSYQRAVMATQGMQTMFGVGITMGRAEFDTRMHFLEDKLPTLKAKPGVQLEMRDVNKLSL